MNKYLVMIMQNKPDGVFVDGSIVSSVDPLTAEHALADKYPNSRTILVMLVRNEKDILYVYSEEK